MTQENCKYLETNITTQTVSGSSNRPYSCAPKIPQYPLLVHACISSLEETALFWTTQSLTLYFVLSTKSLGKCENAIMGFVKIPYPLSIHALKGRCIILTFDQWRIQMGKQSYENVQYSDLNHIPVLERKTSY